MPASKPATMIEAPAPESMIGSLASIPLPKGPPGDPPLFLDPLQVRLFESERIEVPVMGLDNPARRLLRISAQAYNDRGEYARLAAVLPRLLGETSLA